VAGRPEMPDTAGGHDADLTGAEPSGGHDADLSGADPSGSSGSDEAGNLGTTPAPDQRLVAAAAMVFVDEPRSPVVSAADARHLLDVLRLRPGESVIAADGAGRWVPCVVGAGTTGRGSRGDLASVVVPDGDPVRGVAPRPALTVAFAPVKGDRPEWVVQKLTELGVDQIVPILTQRSVVRWEGDRADRAVERLRKVAMEAAAQSRRLFVPEISGVTSIDELGGLTGQPPSLAHPGGTPPSLAQRVVAIGPEGGWTDEELDGGGGLVGLGPTVLRAETAAVVAGTLLCALRAALVAPLA